MPIASGWLQLGLLQLVDVRAGRFDAGEREDERREDGPGAGFGEVGEEIVDAEVDLHGVALRKIHDGEHEEDDGRAQDADHEAPLGDRRGRLGAAQLQERDGNEDEVAHRHHADGDLEPLEEQGHEAQTLAVEGVAHPAEHAAFRPAFDGSHLGGDQRRGQEPENPRQENEEHARGFRHREARVLVYRQHHGCCQPDEREERYFPVRSVLAMTILTESCFLLSDGHNSVAALRSQAYNDSTDCRLSAARHTEDLCRRTDTPRKRRWDTGSLLREAFTTRRSRCSVPVVEAGPGDMVVAWKPRETKLQRGDV